MESSSKKILNIARISFAGIMILLLGISSFCIYRLQDLNEGRKRVNDLQNLVELQEQVVSASKDFVIAARGFYIIRDSSYIKPFENGKSVYINNMHKLETLYSMFGLDKEEKLKQMIQRRLDYTVSIIDKTKRNKLDSAVFVIKRANPLIDSISKQAKLVRMDVQNQISDTIYNNTEKFKTVTSLFVVLAGTILIVLISLFYFLRFDISGRIKAENDLQEKNMQLQYAYEDMETKITFRNIELERQNIELKKRINELEKR